MTTICRFRDLFGPAVGLALLTLVMTSAAFSAEVFWEIESQRLDREITDGNYAKALELVQSFQKEFRKMASEMTPRDRNARKLELRARMMMLQFKLANVNKLLGNYEDAKRGFDSAIDDFEDIRDKLFQQYRIAQAYRGAYEQIFLSMWDRGTVRGMVNSAKAVEAADRSQNSLSQELFDLECNHALLLDAYGAMELDRGNLAATERHFRNGLKIREFLGGAKLATLGGPHLSHYATFARNFGRLYLKQGDKHWEDGDADEARKLYERAEVYFKEAGKPLEDAEKQAPDVVKYFELGMADLFYNKAELAMSRAVSAAKDGERDDVEELLDEAEQWLLQACDTIEKQLKTRDHPYLVYCWADLAGVGARRAVLLDKTMDEYPMNYIRQAEELMKNREMSANSPQARILELEKKWVERADVARK